MLLQSLGLLNFLSHYLQIVLWFICSDFTCALLFSVWECCQSLCQCHFKHPPSSLPLSLWWFPYLSTAPTRVQNTGRGAISTATCRDMMIECESLHSSRVLPLWCPTLFTHSWSSLITFTWCNTYLVTLSLHVWWWWAYQHSKKYLMQYSKLFGCIGSSLLS